MSANDHDPRLEEAVAFALGSLDPEQAEDFKEHLKTCKRCQEELRWLGAAGGGRAPGGGAQGAPPGAEGGAVGALPGAVEPQAPPPELKARLMAEVRADAEADERRARAEKRGERTAGGGFSGWPGGPRVGGPALEAPARA